MVAGGDDAGGHVEEALAPEERGQDLAGIDAAAVQVAPTVGEEPHALAPGGGAELELDLGEGRVGMRGRRARQRPAATPARR